MSEEDRLPTDLVEETRLQKALRESVILRELADILNSSLDLEHILQALVKRTTELCAVTRCAVWLLEEPWNRLRAITYYITSPELAREMGQKADTIWYRTHLPIDNPVIQRLLAEGNNGILYLEDLRAEASVHHIAETFQVRSMLLIALVREGRPVGMMALDDPGQSRTFSQEELQLARAIGQQATIAIDNARLYQQAQAQQRRAENLIQRARAIYQVAMTVNSGEDLSVVLQLATKHLVRALEANDGIALLLDEHETFLRPVGSVSTNPHEAFSTTDIALNALPNCRKAIASGRPTLIDTRQAEDQESAWMRQLNLKTILVVPLMGSPPQHGANWDLESKGTLLAEDEDADLTHLYCHGLLALYYKHQHRPTRGEYAFAQDIAAQCALAIEKARLLAEAQRSADLANERANTLDAVFQAMTEGITVFTPDEQVLTRNNAAARLLGVPVYSSSSIETFLQQHPTFTLDGQPVSHDDYPLTRALHNGTEVRGERLLITAADGTLRVMEITATPLRNVYQQQTGLVTAFRDVTLQVQAEESLRKSMEALREADKMKDDFLAMTAHEFRNPLAVILLHSQSALRALRRTNTDVDLSSIIDHLATIAGQTKQLDNIVTTFLDAARINQGQITLNNDRVDLGKIAQQIVNDHRNLATGHTLHYQIQESEQPYLVMGDQARLEQIITNLVGNAIKYSPFGGDVTISIRRNRSEKAPTLIEVSIEDQGVGIPPEAQARLFERFYRAPQIAGSEKRGAGLGLYIVANLVHLHGGEIHVTSSGKPGEGSCFRFTLPELTSSAENVS